MFILKDKYIYTSIIMYSNRDTFVCPITHQIFKDPVLAIDRIYYEREAIEEWFKNNNTSPITREIIDKIVISSILFNNLLNEYLEKNPDELKNQYICKFNEIIFNDYIKKNDLIDLEKYVSQFNNITLNNEFNVKLLKNNDLVKILFDHQINIDNKNNLLLIHYICIYSTPEMIKYIIDKGVDLECTTTGGWKPIHYICRYSTPEMIQYIIDKGVDLECSDNEGWKPIHFICRYSTLEMIQYIIDKGVDLECTTNDKWKPIHFICQYSTPDMIKYIIDKGVDLECTDNNGWKPIHSICNISTPEMFKYIIDKGVNTTTTILKYKNKNVNYNLNDIINERFKENIQYSKNDFLQYLT